MAGIEQIDNDIEIVDALITKARKAQKSFEEGTRKQGQRESLGGCFYSDERLMMN